MKFFTKSVLALCLTALVACDSKGIFYPVQPEVPGEETTETQCAVTIPVDWTLVDPSLPLRTSSHLYIYDVDGNFIDRVVKEATKDFVVALERGVSYNFFVTDNLLTAQQEEMSLNLENTEDYYALNFVGTNFSGEGHLSPTQGAIKPYAYATLSGYTVPDAETATTETLIPDLGSVNINIYATYSENIIDLNVQETAEGTFDVTIDWSSIPVTAEQLKVERDANGNFVVSVTDATLSTELEAISRQIGAVINNELTYSKLALKLNNMCGNLAVQKPDHCDLPVTAKADLDNYSVSIIPSSDLVVLYSETAGEVSRAAAAPGDRYFISVGASTDILYKFHTFGYILDKTAVPFNIETYEISTLTFETQYYNWDDMLVVQENVVPVIPIEMFEELGGGSPRDPLASFEVEQNNDQLTYIYRIPSMSMGGGEMGAQQL